MLYGDNGILNKAKFASEEYKNATEEEKEELAKVDDYIGNSRETVTISKEEYDKLKNANTYTTDEIKIGTWINGKSLYRKVMEFKNLTYDKNLFIRNLGIQNVENYCRCEVYHIYDNMQGFESYRSSSSSYYLDWYISNGNIYIDNKIHNVTNYDYIVILEYTKTID